MKKLINTIVFMLLLTLICNAQDIIVKKDGTEIKTKVEVLSDTEVKYKNFDNLTGPFYLIEKSLVFMIKYENGTKEMMETKPKKDEKVEKSTQNTNFYTKGVNVFTENGIKLSKDEVRTMLRVNPIMLEDYENSRKKSVAGIGLICVGAVGGLTALAFNLSQDITSPDYASTAPLTYTSLAIEGVGFLLHYLAKNEIRSTIRDYNNMNAKKTSFKISPQFSNNGLGLCLTF
jgi:hypothetical protein